MSSFKAFKKFSGSFSRAKRKYTGKFQVSLTSISWHSECCCAFQWVSGATREFNRHFRVPTEFQEVSRHFK